MREHGSVLYLEMAKEILNLPQMCISRILLSANWQQQWLRADFEQGLSMSWWMEVCPGIHRDGVKPIYYQECGCHLKIKMKRI